MTDLIPRATVEAICALRDRSLEQFAISHSKLYAALEASKDAYGLLHKLRGRENAHSHHQRGQLGIMHVAEPQDREGYLAVARKIVDTEVWAHVVELTRLERLMDRTAKDELTQQLMKDPPEATVENVYATLERLAADSGSIFRRGIAKCFSDLDRRFRSHDGFKVGSRMVLTRMFDENGWFNYHRNVEATLLDIERTFLVLDGQPVPDSWAGIVGKLREARTGHGPRQTEVDDEYFVVRAFKNGNAHVWFKRDDLVEKVNKLLAEHYGEVVGDGMTREADPLRDPKTTLARNAGWFPTPDKVAGLVVDEVPLHGARTTLEVLEPSAGAGALALPIARHVTRPHVDAVEVDPGRAAVLRRHSPPLRKVFNADFMAIKATPAYDRVVMNPPFDRERDVDHVVHAFDFLRPDGCLVAIMSAGTEHRQTAKTAAFRSMIERLNGRFWDLPPGSFRESGTECNTVVLKVWRDGRYFYR